MRHEDGLYATLLCPGVIKITVFKAGKKKKITHEKDEGSIRIS